MLGTLRIVISTLYALLHLVLKKPNLSKYSHFTDYQTAAEKLSVLEKSQVLRGWMTWEALCMNSHKGSFW